MESYPDSLFSYIAENRFLVATALSIDGWMNEWQQITVSSKKFG